jgi:hypothetical protein
MSDSNLAPTGDPESWSSYRRSVLGRLNSQDEVLASINKIVIDVREKQVAMEASARTVLYVLGIFPSVIALISLILSIWLAVRGK